MRGAKLGLVIVIAFAGCRGSKDNKQHDKTKGDTKQSKSVPNTSKQNTREVRQMFAQLRVGLVRYRAKHEHYLGTGKERERWPPVLSYGQQHGALSTPDVWKKLGVKRRPATLRCSYAVVTGKANDLSNVGEIARKRFGMRIVDKRTSSTGQVGRSIKRVPDDDWFYLFAECDGDGDPKRNAFWLLRHDLPNTFRIDRQH